MEMAAASPESSCRGDATQLVEGTASEDFSISVPQHGGEEELHALEISPPEEAKAQEHEDACSQKTIIISDDDEDSCSSIHILQWRAPDLNENTAAPVSSVASAARKDDAMEEQQLEAKTAAFAIKRNNGEDNAGVEIQEQVPEAPNKDFLNNELLVVPEHKLNEKANRQLTYSTCKTREININFHVETPKITRDATMLTNRDSSWMSASRSKSRSIASVRTGSLRASGLRAAARVSLTGFRGFERIDKHESIVEVTPDTANTLSSWGKSSNQLMDHRENCTSMSIESGPTIPDTKNDKDDENDGPATPETKDDKDDENEGTAAWQGQHQKNHVIQRVRKLVFENDELPVSHPGSWQDNSSMSFNNKRSVSYSDLKNAEHTDNAESPNKLFSLEFQNQGRSRGLRHHGNSASCLFSISTDLDSQEPGEDSQTNALNMVDKLLLLNATGISEDSKSDKIFFPPVSGPQTVNGACALAYNTEAKKLHSQLDVFDWDDDQHDEAAGAEIVSEGSGVDKCKLKVLKMTNLRKRCVKQNKEVRSTHQDQKKNDVSNGKETAVNKTNTNGQSISNKIETWVRSNMLPNDVVDRKSRSVNRKTRNSMRCLHLEESKDDISKKRVHDLYENAIHEQYGNNGLETLNEKYSEQFYQSKCMENKDAQLRIAANPPKDGNEGSGQVMFQNKSLGDSDIGSGTQVALDAIQMLSLSTATLDCDKGREEKENRQMKACDIFLPAVRSGRSLRRKTTPQNNYSESRIKNRTKEKCLETPDELIIYSEARCKKRVMWAQGVKTRLQSAVDEGSSTMSLENIKTRLRAAQRKTNLGNERVDTSNMDSTENDDTIKLVVPHLRRRRSQCETLVMQQNKSTPPHPCEGMLISPYSEQDSVQSRKKPLQLNRRYATRKHAFEEGNSKYSDSCIAANLGAEEYKLSTFSSNKKLHLKMKNSVGFSVESMEHDATKDSGRNFETFEEKTKEHKKQICTSNIDDVSGLNKQDGVPRKKRIARVSLSVPRRTTRSLFNSLHVLEAKVEGKQEAHNFDKERCSQQSLQQSCTPGNVETVTKTAVETPMVRRKKQPRNEDNSVDLDLHTVYRERLRKKRCAGNVKVLFSHGLPKDTLKNQEKILTRLGGHIASSAANCTHFVVDTFARTRNMLEAMASGKAVVTTLWLETCGQACYFVDEKNYILQDSEKEKELSFSMRSSLAAAEQHPLLKGRKVFLSPNASPDTKSLQAIVEAAGGQVVQRLGNTYNQDQEECIIISSAEDTDFCLPFLENGMKVFSPELILGGIVCHSLDFPRNMLFSRFGQQPRCPCKRSASTRT